MTEHVTLCLPWPDRSLSPNARVDRRARAGIVREHRAAAAMVAGALQDPLSVDKEVDLSVIFYPPDNRRRDLDNCYSMCKAYQDGIFEAFGLDDRCIRMVTLRFGKPRERGEVVFSLSDADKVVWM